MYIEQLVAYRTKRRRLLYIANALSAILGVVCTFLGCIYIISYVSLGQIVILQKRIRILLPLLLIMFGLVVSIKSIASFYCIIQEYANFSSIVTIIILCVISYACAIILIKLRNTTLDIAIKNAMIRRWGQKKTKVQLQYWDEMQTKFNCCGLFDWRDWGQSVPNTCGGNRERGCLQAMILLANTLLWSHWHRLCCNILLYLPYTLYVLIIKDAILIYYLVDIDFDIF